MPKAYSDKERLDWLTRKTAVVCVGKRAWRVFSGSKTIDGNTPRQVIDAAMRAEKKGADRAKR